VGVTYGPNTCRLVPRLTETGDLEIAVVTSRLADDGRTFGYEIGVVGREEIKTIHGHQWQRTD